MPLDVCFVHCHVGVVSGVPLVWLMDETHLNKGEICTALRLLPDTSTVLEQIRVFKTSVVAKLTVCQGHTESAVPALASQAAKTLPNLPPST